MSCSPTRRPPKPELVEEGVVARRTPFMENFFVIAGPREDPAQIAKASSPTDAVRRIAKAGARWVSRADDSGTHKKEKEPLQVRWRRRNGRLEGF